MDAAIKMVNEFLPKDQLIVYPEGKAFPRSEGNEAYSDGTGAFQNNQIVVLMDEWSASASEIFAGAIQDNDRGMIIGRRSFGKGLVQQQIPFSDGSAIRLTIARYYTPSGRSIQKEYKMGDIEDYNQDLMNRFLHGEFDTKDSIKLNDSLSYETRNERIVYGGGGIMPDIFVPRDTIGVTSYLNNVVNNGIIYQFALEYTNNHRQELSQFKDYGNLLKYLKRKPLLDEFVTYAASKGVKPRPVYINISRKIINNQLHAYIARNLLGDEAFYPILMLEDKTFLKIFLMKIKVFRKYLINKDKVMCKKSDIRMSIKDLKKNITAEERTRFSEQIRCRIEQLPEFKQAKTILLYHSLPDEVDTSSFLKLWKEDKRLLLPAVKGDNLIICNYHPEKLKTGSYGIIEPQGNGITDLSVIDMIIIPGIAFDKKRNRLGRGKGYYDRLLPQVTGCKIGICYNCQITDLLPTEKHDIPMNYIISESGII